METRKKTKAARRRTWKAQEKTWRIRAFGGLLPLFMRKASFYQVKQLVENYA